MKAYINVNNTTLSSEIIKNSYSLKENYFNSLKSADNICSFSIPFDETIANAIKNNINKDLPAYILDDSLDFVFNGYLKKSASFEKESNVKEIALEIVSPSYFLDENFADSYSVASATLEDAVKYILECAKITSYDLSALPSKIIPVFSVTDEETFKDVLDQLLNEYGYTYDFNSDGEFICNPIFDEPGTITQTFVDGASGNIYGTLSQDAEEKDYDGVKATYDKLKYGEKQTIFSDESSHEISTGGYLYDNTEGTYCEYDCTLGEVKIVTDVTDWTVQFGSFKLTKSSPTHGKYTATLENCGTRALLKVYNGSSYSATVSKVEIIGQGYFVESSDTVVTASGTKYDEVSLRFIADYDNALSYAQKLTHYFQNANFKVSFKSKLNYDYGTFVTVTASKMGTIKGRIVQKTYRLDTELITYQVEACADYSTIGTSLNTVIPNKVLTSTAVGEIAAQSVETVVSATKQHYLATSQGEGVTVETEGWTELVQAINSVDRYLWTYQSVEYTSGGQTYTSNSEPVISGVYGEKGVTGSARILSNLYESGTDNEVGIYRGAVYVYSAGVWSLANTEGYIGVKTELPELVSGAYWLCGDNFSSVCYLKAGSGVLATKDGKAVTVRKSFKKGFIYANSENDWVKVPKSDYRYTVIMVDSYNTTGELPEGVKEVIETPVIDKIGTYQGKLYEDPEEPVKGDFYLYEEQVTTSNRKSGYLYKYNGEQWVELDPTNADNYVLYMQSLSNALEVSSPAVGAFSTLFANVLIANSAIIANLQTKVLTLQNGGTIKSKGYNNNPTSTDGFVYIYKLDMSAGSHGGITQYIHQVIGIKNDQTRETFYSILDINPYLEILYSITDNNTTIFGPSPLNDFVDLSDYYSGTATVNINGNKKLIGHDGTLKGFCINSSGTAVFNGDVTIGKKGIFKGYIENEAFKTADVSQTTVTIKTYSKTASVLIQELNSDGYKDLNINQRYYIVDPDDGYKNTVEDISYSYSDSYVMYNNKKVKYIYIKTKRTDSGDSGQVVYSGYRIVCEDGTEYKCNYDSDTWEKDSTGWELPYALTVYGISPSGIALYFLSLPTSTPSESGRVWNDNGTLKIS